MNSAGKNIKLAAISAVLETYKISKTAGVRDLIERALAAKQKYVDDPAMHLIGSAGIGFAKALTNPIHTARDIPNMIHLPLLNRIGFMGGSLAGLGTLGYGAYRGGKALVHKLTAPKDDEHHKTAGVRDLIERALAAKQKYVRDPALGLFTVGGIGLATGLTSPIDTVREIPKVIRGQGLNLLGRLGYTGGALAGLGTLGYGAYRGGKALVHKLTAPKDDEHHKTAGVRDLIARALAAKEQYVVDPAARLFGNLGHGFVHGLASPIRTARGIPEFIRDQDFDLTARIGSTGGALAGLGTLGYGAYRGGKALVHKLTAPDDEHH